MRRHSAESHGCHGAGSAARAIVRLAAAGARDYVAGMASKKTWRQKLETDHDLPKVERIPARMAKTWGKGTIVIAAPREVDALMARVPKGNVTPYWRTLKAGGELNPKFPGGLEVLRSRLEAEGHEVIARGKRLFVAEYTKRLVRPQAE
jgi:alkylated DNA nucleotide flippase Atl1